MIIAADLQEKHLKYKREGLVMVYSCDNTGSIRDELY
jgi:hypothetical protein